MANLLEKYGIKEVADVTFYDIDSGAPVLYLDTLKVSTIEQTAENTSARGGKGNPELIIWDYNKEITVTLEDALYSAKSMALMFGDSAASSDAVAATVTRFINYTATNTTTSTADISAALPKTWGNKAITATASTIYNSAGSSVDVAAMVKGETYMVSYTVATTGKVEIVISADTFPGTYKVVGDTYSRSYRNGEDTLFQFVIQKAKVQSEVTLTMEAEGDPSTFNLNLKVLRPSNGEMMKLVQYKL